MKRFYKQAQAVETRLGWQVELDGRPVKTQGGAAQLVQSEGLSRLLAAEWSDQGAEIDPKSFRARDLVDHAIDVVAANRDAAIADLLRYAETDTLCYRADPDEPLWRRQKEVWEPLVVECENREKLKLHRVSGVMHRAQDPATLDTIAGRLHRLDDITLAALATLTSLASSLIIGLAALEPEADGPALWDAANLEEEWQARLWGRDAEAEERRAARKGDFLAALALVTALRADRPGS